MLGLEPLYLENTHKALEQGRRLISVQQKLIRQAGDLKLGWREVVEYTCTANMKYRSEEGRAVKLLEEAHRDVPC